MIGRRIAVLITLAVVAASCMLAVHAGLFRRLLRPRPMQAPISFSRLKAALADDNVKILWQPFPGVPLPAMQIEGPGKQELRRLLSSRIPTELAGRTRSIRDRPRGYLHVESKTHKCVVPVFYKSFTPQREDMCNRLYRIKCPELLRLLVRESERPASVFTTKMIRRITIGKLGHPAEMLEFVERKRSILLQAPMHTLLVDTGSLRITGEIPQTLVTCVMGYDDAAPYRSCLLISPDRTHGLTGNKYVNLRERRILRTLDVDSAVGQKATAAEALDFSPDGKLALVLVSSVAGPGPDRKVLGLFDVATGKPLKTRKPAGVLAHAKLLPNSKLVVSYFYPRERAESRRITIESFDEPQVTVLAKNPPIERYSGIKASVRVVNDGRHLVVSGDKGVAVYDIPERRLVFEEFCRGNACVDSGERWVIYQVSVLPALRIRDIRSGKLLAQSDLDDRYELILLDSEKGFLYCADGPELVKMNLDLAALEQGGQ